MHTLKKIIGLGAVLCCASAIASADMPCDSDAIAEQCRQVALKLDWLGRYQDRPTCIKNLDGLNAYTASQYILSKQYKKATALLNMSIIQTNFAIDVGCYGQDDMKQVVSFLKKITTAISFEKNSDIQ